VLGAVLCGDRDASSHPHLRDFVVHSDGATPTDVGIIFLFVYFELYIILYYSYYYFIYFMIDLLSSFRGSSPPSNFSDERKMKKGIRLTKEILTYNFKSI
jgi:hypothetical protein